MRVNKFFCLLGVLSLLIVLTSCKSSQQGYSIADDSSTTSVLTTSEKLSTEEYTISNTSDYEEKPGETNSYSTDIQVDFSKRGNEGINIWNKGFFAEYQDRYYISSREDQVLYRMKPDGSEKTVIYNEYVGRLNVLDDWIYYSKYGVWKMRLDGSERTLLYDRSQDTGALFDLCVIDRYLFYSVLEENGYSLYRMKTDGTERVELLQDIDRGYYHDEYFYFTPMNNNSINRIRVDGNGSDIEQIRESQNYVNMFAVEDDKIYVADESGILEFDLTTRLTSKIVDDFTHSFNMDDDWIYYENRTESYNAIGKRDDTSSLFKVRRNGTDRQFIAYFWATDMYIPKGDWIYFWNQDKEELDPDPSYYFLAKIRKDGTGFERLFEYQE